MGNCIVYTYKNAIYMGNIGDFNEKNSKMKFYKYFMKSEIVLG